MLLVVGASRSVSLTFHRVSSKENCSDGISRDQWDFVIQFDFCRVEPNFFELYRWLATVEDTSLDVLVDTFAETAQSVSAHQSGEQRAEVA